MSRMGSGSVCKLPKKKSSKRNRTSKRRHTESSGDESVDLTEKVFPIFHFIDNRQEMIDEVFSAVDKEKLNCMLPPILKGMSLNSLKEKCLKELMKMSSDEVHRVLCGESVKSPEPKAKSPLQDDSDSRESVPSIEEIHDQEQEKRTLLDILEQEMQEIAYQTVLKRDEISILDESQDLPEILTIIPAKSQASKNADCNVPLICLDSDDDGASSTVQPSKSTTENLIVDKDMTHLRDGHSAKSLSPLAVASIEALAETKDHANTACSSSALNADPEQVSKIHQKKSPPVPRESFLIQVFPNDSCSSGRVVKKVHKSPCLGKNDENVLFVAETKLRQEESSKSVFGIAATEKKFDLNNDCSISSQALEKTDFNNTNSKKIAEEEPQAIADYKAASPKCHETMDCIEPFPISTLQVEGNSNFEKFAAAKNLDKEEGEITGEESEGEVEILEAVRDRIRSPTVFLSSDSSNDRSGPENSEVKNKLRKYHRHRRYRRSRKSPECPKHHIEKRGNRSYRRKSTTAPKETKKSIEKEKEPVLECQPPENIDDRKSQSADTVTLPENVEGKAFIESESIVQQNNLTLEEDEHLELFIPCSNSEINVPCDMLSSSEDVTESGDVENVSDKKSWADRWAEKKDLKKVVITSKICRNVRKRIISARKRQAIQEKPLETSVIPPVPPLVLHVEGSVQEYEMLQFLVSDVSRSPQENEVSMGDSNLVSGQSNDGEQSVSVELVQDFHNFVANGEATDNSKILCDSSSTVSTSDSAVQEPLSSMECT